MTIERAIRRRRFLAIAGGAIATPLLARCAPPRDGRTLVTCIPGDPPTMNAAVSGELYCIQASSPVYSNLVTVGHDGALTPDLAERWEASDDGRTYTFHLRRGVRWHDGRPFGSADVSFTIGEMLSRLHPNARNAYKTLRAIETPDDHTVMLRFDPPIHTFLSLPQALGPILPKHRWAGTDYTLNPLDKAPVGTGPFRFIEYRTGNFIRYARNDAYHVPGEPHFDELIMSIMPDPVARSFAFENGEIDCIYANDLPSTDLPRLSALPGVGVTRSFFPGGIWMGVLNTRKTPFADTRVRQALAHAVDRKFILDNSLPGMGLEMAGPLYPSSPLYDRGLTDYAFDPATANRLLDAARLPRGPDGRRFSFEMVWNGSFGIVTRMALIMAQNLKAVGIEAVLKPIELQAVIQRFIDSDFGMVIATYALGPDPDFGMERLYNSNNIRPMPYSNNSGYRNPEVDRLFEEQRLTGDRAERKAIYDRIQALIWKDIPTLPLFAYPSQGYFHADYVTGLYDGWTPAAESFARARPRRG